MKTENIIKDDLALYMEHKWVKKYVCPAKRTYILISYIAYGKGSVILNNQRFEVSAKDIFIVNTGTKAEFIAHDDTAENYNFEIHYILFEKEFLRGEWEKYADEFVGLENFFNNSGQGYIKVTDSAMCEIRSCIVRMTNEYYENAPSRKSAILGHMLSMLPLIFRRYNVHE